MAQTVLVTLTTAGVDSGPFSLYSDADGYAVPIVTGISRATMLAGYLLTAPDLATTIKVQSTGVCTNFDLIPISLTSTSTTTSTSSTTSTSTSTSTSSTSSTTTSTTTLASDTIAGSFTVANSASSYTTALVNLGGYGAGATVGIGAVETLLPTGLIVTPGSAAFVITSSDGTGTVTVLSNTLACTNATVVVTGSGTTTVTITVTPTNYNGSTDVMSGDIAVGISTTP